MLSQNILNFVDTAMVSRLGDAALAAVGTGGFINFMAIALVTGLSAGVQAVAARRKGEGRDNETAIPLNGAMVIAVTFGIPMSLILFACASPLFALVNSDPQVLAEGSPYLKVRLIAMVAVGLNFSFRGYWNGIHLPKLYLFTLVAMHSLNIFLNWVLIFGHLGAPAMGTTGAGLATTIATCLGSCMYIGLGFAFARGSGFLHGLPSRETMKTILRLSVPNGVQQLFFAAGFTMLFKILGLVGTSTTAAANVLINVMLIAILPGIALGIAAASLVGSALGRGDVADARRWGWDVVKVAVVLLFLLGLPMLLAPDAIFYLFELSPQTQDLARLPLRIVGGTICIDGVGLVLQHALLGAGASRSTMVISIVMQWVVFLPFAYLVGPVLGYGLLGIWLAQIGYRLIQAGIFTRKWMGNSWTEIRV
ncbi:MAG: MATE family efflux transporter [Acidobacteria bacterium]|nr:MATE family efflux transporter [Acidobacteriota bacterium]